MRDATLVIMAAGIGSRFGGGIKQLEPVGINGEIIMDYSIHDAIEAGFNKIVFVIRKSLEKDFKEIIGDRVEKIVNVKYAFQELENIPDRHKGKLDGRIKPWGTGQAILSCKGIINEPFLVINADDYYGKEAYRAAYQYLMSMSEESDPEDIMDICMVGFVLKNTLSKNGAVTRGICKVDADGMLAEIEETYEIEEKDGYAAAEREGEEIRIPLDSAVSMNMWGLPKSFLDYLETGFENFLEELEPGEIKKEYLLPQIIDRMLKRGEVQVKVLSSNDKWFGITYKEDKKEVTETIRNMIERGVYPEKLY